MTHLSSIHPGSLIYKTDRSVDMLTLESNPYLILAGFPSNN